jgi:2-polyprenyl-3-methyl-5-hydroxy-6-metoxy-1,4-benzoquinol methylase
MNLLGRILGIRCRLCGKRGSTGVGSVAPTHPGTFHTRNFTLRHCRHCDVIYLAPLPTTGDLKTLYEDSVQFSDAHYTDPAQVEKILDYYGTAIRNLELLPSPEGRVLEVGAGLAWVSRACKAMNPEIVTVAQDVSGECALACPWVDRYFAGTLDDLPERGPYQLISLTHVIEHLADPAGMLQKIGELLASDGKIFVTAPFRPTDWNPAQGITPWRSYSYLHVPAHITYLSRRWFEQHTDRSGLCVAAWDDSHENGQVFELVLRKA